MNVTRSTHLQPWRMVLALSVLVSLSFVQLTWAGAPTRLVVFGDSLSDPGNYFAAFGTVTREPFVPVPDAPYAIGGHHFSNGATWAERLAAELHVPTSGKPALRNPGAFTNYAVGRARARTGAPEFSDYDLTTQVGLFLSDFEGQATSTDLYVIWIGANDLSDALSALPADPSGLTSEGILQAALTALVDNVETLWASGARSFLILNLPDPAVTPAVRALGADAQFAATQLTAAYNAGLDQALDWLQALPALQVLRFDVEALFGDIVADPGAVGLADVGDPCLTFGIIGHAICQTPRRYLFWDGIHPTTAAHAILAEAALAVIPRP